MKSIRPSKETLVRRGVIGILMILIGIGAIIMGAMEFLPFIGTGVFAVVVGIIYSVRSFKNAFGENRESLYDIVDSSEDADEIYLRKHSDVSKTNSDDFCPYCGAKAGKDYAYCAKCGKKLP